MVPVPLPAAVWGGLGLVSAHRLGRLGRDLPWLLAVPLAWLALRWWLAQTPEGLAAVAELALERGTGARGLRSILESALLPTMLMIA